MADVIRKATNKFTKGLIMDFSPENTRNEVLTHALNATLLTFNGNELSLQNDMGNARVETAYLPNGYMPVGTCEYGGIIYIVSYNPLENKSQIGCFPSPERNISQEELGHNTEVIDSAKFADESGKIHNNSYKVLLKQSNLNPGDKFLIHSNPELVQNRLKDLLIKDDNDDTYKEIDNPIIALNVVSIEDSGKIVYLNNTVRRYDFNANDKQYKYFITPNTDSNGNLIDLDSYRNALSSGYSVFKEKTSGKLAILAELITIDSYSVTHSIIQQEKNPGVFDIILHTEVSPELTSDNYYQNPKLAYYYLEESEGYLQVGNDSGNTIKMSDSGFMNTKLSDIYVPTDESFSQKLNKTLTQEGALFDFPIKETYHRRERILNGEEFGNDNPLLTTEFKERAYHRVSFEQLDLDYFINDLQAKFYTFNGDSETYTEYTEETINWDYVYYIKQPVITYINVERDVAYSSYKLYKQEVILLVANNSVIQNKEIEKFKEEKEYIYRKASDEDKNGTETLFFKSGVDSYKEASKPLDPNVVYYILETKITHVSLGFEIEPEQVPSVVYYYANIPTYSGATQEDLDIYWDFDTYPDKAPFDLFRRDEVLDYVQVSESFLENYTQGSDKIYTKDGYLPINFDLDLPTSDPILVIFPKTTMVKYDKFQPQVDINYIEGYDTPTGVYPGEKPIKLSVVEQYLPSKPIENNDLDIYKDVKLATLKLPSVVSDNNLAFPFTYDYTIIPCMEFGKLDHLKVKNTIDFSKLSLFNQSEFDVWRYIINGDQLIFTIGAQVYDTFETYKVDGIVLEFYDNQGCVGLIDILNKKSYSGQFTKSLYLNTKGELKSKSIEFNNGSVYGQYTDISKRTDNQEGLLQSNLIYLVQPYLRVTEGNQYKFIKKNKLFLFTMPIFNDYYYNTDNFNSIKNPKLNMVLTYQITDTSNLKSIDFGNNEEVSEYQSGKSDKTSIDFTSTVNYTGTSQLQLAVGLHKDYAESGLLSDVAISKIFNCRLNIEPINGQGITFKKEETEKTTLEVSDSDFDTYNFLTQSDKYINIEYNFTVSYTTHINNIKDTSVPATTICALYHQQPNGIYNYADFGLYEVSNGNDKCYLSDLVMYNSGSTKESIFGIARMAIAKDSEPMYQQCTSYRQYTQDVISLTTPGRLNAGDPLKSIVNSIGKLSFCQPHAHCLLEGSYKSNIIKNQDNTYTLASNALESHIINHPIYNLSANTIDLIDYQTKFVSAVSYKSASNSTEYNGMTLRQITKFNRLLLNSMSTIYAYNPDYKQVQLRVGDVVVDNPEQTFSSILYCDDSNFDFGNGCLNDYLNLVKNDEITNLNTYLENLFQNCDGSACTKEQFPQLYFEPDYTYCGKENNPYLISELTYNIKVPDKLYEDLSFDFSKGLFIKHSDSSWDYLEGDINRNILYGFLQQDNKKKLIQLDVTTYNIDQNGFVQIKDNAKSINTETITLLSNIFPEEVGSVQSKFTSGVALNLQSNPNSECSIEWTIPTLTNVQKIDDWIYGFADLRRNISNQELSLSYTIAAISKTKNMNVRVTSTPKIEMTLVQDIDNPDSVVLDQIKNPNDLKWFFNEDHVRDLTLNNNDIITYGENCIEVRALEPTQLPTGFETKITSTIYDNVVFAIVRCKIEDINLEVSTYKNLSDLEDTVIHVNKTNNYFIRNGNVYYPRYTDTNFIGSTITINDLIYRPEIDGHRLYMKDQYNVVSGAKIAYRLEGENLTDLSLNTLQLYSGPCYTNLIVGEKDPEYDLTTFNK